MAELAEELACAQRLARAAGAEVLRMQRGELGVELKPGDEPVTIADKRASQLIVSGLAAAFPDDAIVSEELPATNVTLAAAASRRLWLVDPIDGTKDYIRGEPGFSVMIGLVVDGRPALGAVYQPTHDELYFATADGAFVDERGVARALAVSDVADVAALRLVASKSHRSPKLDEVKQTLGIANEQNVGSIGLKLCMIAAGVKDLYVNPWPKTKPWDTCAPEAILARAGGRLTDVHGAALDYTRLEPPRGLVASNGRAHGEIVAKLAPLFA